MTWACAGPRAAGPGRPAARIKTTGSAEAGAGGAGFDPVRVRVQPGDRLILCSDGFTECPLPNGKDFGEDGLTESLRASANLSGSDLLEAMVWDLTRAAGTESFPDDVSGIVLDLLPQEPGQHRPVSGIAQPGHRIPDG